MPKEVIEKLLSPATPHEYTTLAHNKHVCKHCHREFNKLIYVKFHIKRTHRQISRMSQCLYCSHHSNQTIRYHILQKHRNIKDIAWFLYSCTKCNYKTYQPQNLKMHKINHLRPEEIQYFLCYYCEYKCKQKDHLKRHMYCHAKKEQIKPGKRYHCKKCNYKTVNIKHFYIHKLIHLLRTKETKYFYCCCCKYKCQENNKMQTHFFEHFKKGEFKHPKKEKSLKFSYYCMECNYKAYMYQHLKTHKLIHLRPKEIGYFYCFHCSYKCKQKVGLIKHIKKH